MKSLLFLIIHKKWHQRRPTKDYFWQVIWFCFMKEKTKRMFFLTWIHVYILYNNNDTKQKLIIKQNKLKKYILYTNFSQLIVPIVVNPDTNWIKKSYIGFSTLHPCMSKDVQRLCLGHRVHRNMYKHSLYMWTSEPI